MAASAALAGLAGCTKMPEQKIVPYVRPPEEIIPGRPLFYATSLTMGGVATGVLVESNMGRPTKVEGNPLHPGSLGATDIFAQAAVLGLYDPDRSQTIIHEGRISTWGTFVSQVNDLRNNFAATKGAGLHLLTETITSPSLAAQIQALLKEFPEAKWHQWEPCSRDNVRAGVLNAIGREANPIYRFDKADVILSLDADFLYSGPGAVRYARDFASRRLSGDGLANSQASSQAKMNRLYVVEQGSTTTGSMADHRLAIRASDIAAFTSELAGALHVPSSSSNTRLPSGVPVGWIEALARDLQNHRGACVVVPGEQQPAVVHSLAHAINVALGNENSTVVYGSTLEAVGSSDLGALVKDMDAGSVHALFILGSNPVYSAAADLTFAGHLLKVPFRAHVGLYEDETAELCHWHIPAAHTLESWGDALAYDGRISFMQPLIAPLYDGKAASEIFSVIQGHADKNAHDLMQEFGKHKRPTKILIHSGKTLCMTAWLRMRWRLR